jgi:hypothetical protein
MWSELTVEREQELDVDLPIPEEADLHDILAPMEINRSPATRDDWQYSPPERDHADVKEVWFAGDLIQANASAFTL